MAAINLFAGGVMKTIGVVGAGVMGKGVAQCLVENGYLVDIYDTDSNVLGRVLDDINRNIKTQNLFSKTEKINPGDICDRIMIGSDLSCVSRHPFIIESITEDIDIKKSLYLKLGDICTEKSIIMSNTSCISITMLGSFTPMPERVIGVHFMNPVPMIQAVEVIRGLHTSEDTINKVRILIESLHKELFLVKDLPGFVSNRISHLMMNEAATIVLHDSLASAETVDNIFKKCYGHKMGPLETADLIGLDVVVKSLKVLYDYFQDQKYKCCPLLEDMVKKNLLGRKSGQGFYKYGL